MYGGKIETLHVILVDTLNKLMTFRIQKKTGISSIYIIFNTFFNIYSILQIYYLILALVCLLLRRSGKI